MPTKRSQFLLVFVLLFVTLVSLYAAFGKKILTLIPHSSVLGAELIFSEGETEYQSNTADGWKTARSGMAIVEGMGIRIIGNGKAIVNIDDGSSVRLSSNSTVTFVSLRPNHIVVRNIKGSVYTRVIPSKRIFEVATDTLSYQSLGTAYKTTNTQDDKGVEVYENSVRITGNKLDVVVPEGKKYYVSDSRNSTDTNTIADISLPDVKKDEFIMWNKNQDEKNDEYKQSLGILAALPPPSLIITSPSDGFITDKEQIEITGKTDPNGTLIINGETYELPTATFQKTVPLPSIGNNTIAIKVIDQYGTQAEKTITVIRKAKEAPTAKPTIKPTVKPTIKPTANQTRSIHLSAAAKENGIQFEFTVQNTEEFDGFKLTRNESGNPVYPGNDALYIDSGKRSAFWEVTDGKVWHFRICFYRSGSCTTYSNDIEVQAPKKTSENTSGSVSSISLSITGGKSVSWGINGTSPMGFKIVWSKNDQPTYPPRNDDDLWAYDSNPDTRSWTIDPKKGSGRYFVRVCEYLGGKCGTYSNQIELTAE